MTARKNIERNLEEALQRPEAERAAFVDEQCGDDVELRRELLELLKHHEDAEADGFLQSRPDLPVTEILQQADNERHAEANLLFGALAYQLEYIDLAQFSAVCRAWAADKSRPLPELLVERGWIDGQAKAELLRLAERKRNRYGGDVHATLGAVADGAVRDAIKQVDDAAVQATISSLPPAAGYVLTETITEPGTKKSRYTLTRLHAEGGLGQVWVAHDDQLQREVAFKQLRARQSANPEAWRRFLKEAQVTGQLGHPNIVPVYELGRDDQDQPFYTMRLVEGQTLKDAIAESHQDRHAGQADPLAQRRLLDAFISICNAISYAHSRGVLHRDLKPQNVILGGFGEVIVLDWGLAKLGDKEDEQAGTVNVSASAHVQATAAGEIMGTPAYMAPEQAGGRVEQIDVRTDVYGLGAILFEILTGHPPHQPAAGETTQKFLQRIATEESPGPKSVDSTIPRAVDAICAKATARLSEDRYPDAKTLLQDIQHWLADEPVGCCRDSVTERFGRWMRKHRTWARAAAAALVIVTAVSVFATVLVNSARKEQARLREDTNGQRVRAEREANFAREESRRAFRNWYGAQMNLAQRDWEASDARNLLTRLNETAPDNTGKEDLRGFEWYYWDRLLHTELIAFRPTPLMLGFDATGLAFSPDGCRIALASCDNEKGTIQVHDTATRQEVATLVGHNERIRSVSFCPDGKRILSVDCAGEVRSWDGTRCTSTFTLEQGDYRSNVFALSPDGRWIAHGWADPIRICDAMTGKEVLSLEYEDSPREQLGDMTFSADSRYLAVLYGNSLDSSGGSDAATVIAWNIEILTSEVTRYAFSDGRVVVPNSNGSWMAPRSDGAVIDPSSQSNLSSWFAPRSDGTVITRRVDGSHFRSIALSPDGKWLATGSDSAAAKVWDMSSGAERLSLGLPGEGADVILFSPDGKRLASAHGRTVKVWDATTGGAMVTLRGHRNEVEGLAFSPDGRRLASCDTEKTRVWDISAEQERTTNTFACDVEALLRVAPDLRRMTSIGLQERAIRLWDAATGRLLRELTPADGTTFCGNIAFSLDWQTIACGVDNKLSVWNAATGELQRSFAAHATRVESVRFSPDGRHVATGAWPSYSSMSNMEEFSDAQLKVWDALSGREQFSVDGCFPATFDSEGTRIAAVATGRLRILDSANGREMATVEAYLGFYSLDTVVFSPDGHSIAAAPFPRNPEAESGIDEADLNAVKIFDLNSGRVRMVLKGCKEGVYALAFSPDGKRLAGLEYPDTVRMWDLTSGHEVLVLRRSVDCLHPQLTFSKDGTRLACAGGGRLDIWDARPWTPKLKAEYEAQGLVRFYLPTRKTKRELLDAIKRDGTISEAVRQCALELAKDFLPPSNSSTSHEEAHQ